jgi:hypothetical protein
MLKMGILDTLITVVDARRGEGNPNGVINVEKEGIMWGNWLMITDGESLEAGDKELCAGFSGAPQAGNLGCPNESGMGGTTWHAKN